MQLFFITIFCLFAVLLASSNFEGNYEDKETHAGCSRAISVEDGEFYVSGTDSSTGVGACDGKTDTAFGPLSATRDGGDLIVDFSSIGGSKALKGSYSTVDSTITWVDGSVWTKLNDGKADSSAKKSSVKSLRGDSSRTKICTSC